MSNANAKEKRNQKRCSNTKVKADNDLIKPANARMNARAAAVINGREADFIVGDGTEEDAKKALERYHGSSSAAMLLDIDDDKRTLEKIQKFIYVSKDR